MNRRDFLEPRHLGHTAGHIGGAVHELASPEPEQLCEEVSLLHATRQAMATQFEVVLPYGTTAATAIASDAFDEIDRLEQQLSVYRDTSELSRLNRVAAQAAVPVEERLFELLSLAARITGETEGAFDITA